MNATIHVTTALFPTFSEYPVRVDVCQHPPPSVIIVDGFYEGTNRPRGMLCMDCGRETTGDMSQGDALRWLCKEYEWHYQIYTRLFDLVKRWYREQRRFAM